MTAIYGHRGARGLFPENTLEGIKNTLKLPINGIELDIVVSKDNNLLVSHNPFAHPEFCLDHLGDEVFKNELVNNFYLMNYEQIQQFNVGTKQHPDFPHQQKLNSKVPLLTEVYDLLNNKTDKNFTLFLEVKCDSSSYYPPINHYADLVYNFLCTHPFKGKLIVKSFDIDFMNAFYAKSKDKFHLGLLVENKNHIIENLKSLNFKPDFYNPEYTLIDEQLVTELHSKDIKIVTWTINHQIDYQQMVNLNVDGVITDYPNEMIKIIRKKWRD